MSSHLTVVGTEPRRLGVAPTAPSLQVSAQLDTTYGWDETDRLTSITRGTATVTLTYDDADRRATVTRPNGVVTTYGYNDADLVTELTYAEGETTLGTLSTTYDALGRPRTLSGSLARTLLPPALASAAYDEGNRLPRWGGTTFSFDANGTSPAMGRGVIRGPRATSWTR